MPQGIRSLTEQFGARVRPGVDGVRALALGLLFLLLCAATLGPAAMAVTLPDGASAQSAHIKHGGETPPAPDTTPSLSSSRSTPRLLLAADVAFAAAAMPVPSASRRRRIARRLHPAVSPPRHGPPRRQHRGRAPPR